jgi:RHS repeat-associated protein
VVLTIDYSGNLIYENNKLKQILVDGGYITPVDSTNKEPVYHFYVQDHLGNNRLVVDEKGTIEQINHYYPFGGLMGESKNLSSNQRYKYNGKELDRMNGLDSYDYGARLHNAPVGRWMSVDPLAEVDYNISPYVYCGDNPVIYTDPTGKVFGIDNVIGGLASGAIEVGSQIVGQYIGNRRDYHISWSKVGVAVAEGFITSGASTGVRVATKVASALANSYIDNKGKGVKGVAMGTVKNIAINGIAKVGSKVVNKTVGKTIGSRFNRVSNKMISSRNSLKKRIGKVGVDAKKSYKAAVAIQSGQKKAANNLRKVPGAVSEMSISAAFEYKIKQVKNENKKK